MKDHEQLSMGIRYWGFTLIELLVVISIIGILAGLVTGLAGVASRKMRENRVRGDLGQISTGVDTYKLELGFYPPDSPRGPHTNQLFYELSGATFTAVGNPPKGKFQSLDGASIILSDTLKKYFDVAGIANSAREKRDVKFTGSHFARSMHQAMDVNEDVELLVVPAPGPRGQMIPGRNNLSLNTWRYDSSSTNRHNRTGYDLWAEIIVGRRTNIIGNWKQ